MQCNFFIMLNIILPTALVDNKNGPEGRTNLSRVKM